MIAITNGGSNRQYFRVEGVQCTVYGVQSYIHVVGTNREENHAFITMARHLRAQGILVPKVYWVSEDEMEYDIEDLGDLSLFDRLQVADSGCRLLLEKTMRALAHIQIEGDKGMDYSVCYPQPEFNRRSVMWDLNYFKYCYLKISSVEMLEEQLEDDFEKMADRLLKAPLWAFMYRDFQSRNVMVRNNEPWFIDFQGGRKGPVQYDVASFLWQAKANYPQELREELIEAYLDELENLVKVDREAFKQNLQHFVLFRTLQVLGAYGYRGLVEKKLHFLQSIPFALKNLEQQLPFVKDNYPYLGTLVLRLISSPGELRGSLCCLPKDGLDPLATSRPLGDKPFGQTIVIKNESVAKLTVDIYSFSYKKGIPEDVSDNGGGFVFDCRATHNPGKYDEYKHLTGLDAPVIKFIEDDGEMKPFMEAAYQLVDQSVKRYLERGFTHLMVSFGCTGGQHRSVYGAEQMAKHLKETFSRFTDSPTNRLTICIHHREQGIER